MDIVLQRLSCESELSQQLAQFLGSIPLNSALHALLMTDLYAFSLIPRFTETTMVNFGLASGLLREALSLDETPSIPVTGRYYYRISECSTPSSSAPTPLDMIPSSPRVLTVATLRGLQNGPNFVRS